MGKAMKKTFVILAAIFITLFFGAPDKLKGAKEIDENSAKIEGSTLLVKLPSSISKNEYQKFQKKSLSKQRASQVEKILYDTSIKAAKTKKTNNFDLIVAYTDENFNVIQPEVFYEPSPAGPPDTNQITFQWITEVVPDCDGTCVPWTDEEVNLLNQTYQEGLPIIDDFFGPPFQNVTYKVKHDPTIPYYGITDASLYTITLKYPSGETPFTKQVLWHEWNHANYTGHKFSGGLIPINHPWSEGMAHAQMMVVETATNTPRSTNPAPVEVANYEQFNNPRYDSTMMNYHDKGPDSSASIYTMAGNIWLKLYRQFPGIIKAFNAEIYPHPKLEFDYFTPASERYYLAREGLAFLNNYISQNGAKTIEGQPFYDWFSKQYVFYKTKGNQKFGARLSSHLVQDAQGQNYEKIILGINYSKSTGVTNLEAYDTPLTGEISYQIISYSQEIMEADNFPISGQAFVDITNAVKNHYGGSIPNERICAYVSYISDKELGEKTDTSCYYLKGSKLQGEQLGITGYVGSEYYDQVTGTVTITPQNEQSLRPQTVNIIKGGFVAPGYDDAYYTAGGSYRLDLNLEGKQITKYITKDVNTYYHTGFSLRDVPPMINSMSSTAVSSNQSTVTLSSDGAVSYFVEVPGKPLSFSGKGYELNGYRNQSYTLGIVGQFPPISSSSSKLSFFTTDDKAEFGIFGPKFDFGTVGQVYIIKWPNKYIVPSGEDITYNIKAQNLSDGQLSNLNLSDPLVGGINYKNNSAKYNSEIVTDAQDGDNFSAVNNVLTWLVSSLNPKDRAGSFFTGQFKASPN